MGYIYIDQEEQQVSTSRKCRQLLTVMLARSTEYIASRIQDNSVPETGPDPHASPQSAMCKSD